MYLVNSKELLINGSFIKAGLLEFVEAGTSRLPISGKGKRLFLKIIALVDSLGIRDLVLENVVVVEGFYTNIISEARLRSIGI